MSTTSSPTLLQGSIRLTDQVTQISWTEMPVNPFENSTHQWLPFTVSQLIDLTGDGGTRLVAFPRRNLIADQQRGRINNFINMLFIPIFTRPVSKPTNYTRSAPSLETHFSQAKSNSPYLDAIKWIEIKTGLSQVRIGQLLGVTRQTINNWERGIPIADSNQRRLLSVRDVLERAMSKHPTPNQLKAWLDTPRGADGRTPAELLSQNEIDKARLLAVTTPSPRLIRAQSWIKRPIPEAFRLGAEHYAEALPTEQSGGGDVLDDENADAEDL